MLVSAMAEVTEHLGFGVTASLTYGAPYPFARRLYDPRPPERRADRLEHRHRLPGKRGQGHGPVRADRARPPPDRADEYLEVLYKLWEGSWEDDAVLADPPATNSARGQEEVCKIRHHGEFYQVEGLPPRRALSTAHPSAVPGQLSGRAWRPPRARRIRVRLRTTRPARPPATGARVARRWSAPAVAPRTSGSSWAST